jgi:hypothetical protein
MTSGKIVSWAKKVGDKVNSGDVLLVVESDKAGKVSSLTHTRHTRLTVGKGCGRGNMDTDVNNKIKRTHIRTYVLDMLLTYTHTKKHTHAHRYGR